MIFSESKKFKPGFDNPYETYQNTKTDEQIARIKQEKYDAECEQILKDHEYARLLQLNELSIAINNKIKSINKFKTEKKTHTLSEIKKLEQEVKILTHLMKEFKNLSNS